MELGSILLILAVIVPIGIYLYMPFMARARRTRVNETLEVSALKAERDRVINSLQELDFDHSLNKIPAEDYPIQRAQLMQKGADVLRKLDELTSGFTSDGNDVEARIEQAAAAVRADSSSTVEPLDDDDLESMISSRRKEHKSKSAGFCPKCGKPVLVSDKFCPSCGKSL